MTGTIDTEIFRVCSDEKIVRDTEIFRVCSDAKIVRDTMSGRKQRLKVSMAKH